MVALLTLVSRVLGFLRDAVTAQLLGGTVVIDALTLAWTVPNAFRRLFGEGALSAAFMPIFARTLEQEGRERARELANVLVSTLAVALLLLAGALALVLELLPLQSVAAALRLDGEGLSPQRVELTREFVQWMLPYLAGICVIAQLMSVLHTVGEFRVPALAPIVLNVMWIAGALAAARLRPDDQRAQGLLIAGSILASAVVQFAWHLPKLRAVGLGWRPAWPRITPELRTVLATMGPLLLAVGTGQLNIIVDRTVAAAHLGDGGVHHLYLGMRLMQFPLGLVSVALTTAVFPVLNRLLARRELEAASAATGQALRTNMLLCLPAAAGLLWLGPELVEVLFERGAFREHNTVATARALAGYAWGVPLLGAAMILSRACMALGSLRPLVLAGLVTVAVNYALDLALVQRYGELGLAAATSLTGLVHVGLLARVLGARLPGHSAAQLVLAGLLPMLAATAVMLAALWGTDALLAALFGAGPPVLVTLLADTVAGSLAFALAARRLCPSEWQAVAALWTRRRRDRHAGRAPG